MIDQRLEQLSALMDGELGDPLASNLLGRVGRDPELRGAWERYHLIAQALRGEAIDPAVRNLAAAIDAALHNEPIPVRQATKRPHRASRLAPFAGAALAAGAAFLAVFAVPNLLNGPEVEAPPPPRYAATSTPSAGVAERRWDLDRPDLANKLDLFLANHQEAAPAAGVKGMLPYATLVGYESAR
jgi:sigma-E factor negative regulatory protein RseA